MRQARASFESPNETFDTPRLVNTPGSSALMRRIPSMVSIPERVNSSSPVASVKVSASKMSISPGKPNSRVVMS